MSPESLLDRLSMEVDSWEPFKRTAWNQSPEFNRTLLLLKADPADHGGDERLVAMIATATMDFSRRYEAENLRGLQLTEAELAARAKPPPPTPPPAPAGMGYRPCSRYNGSGKLIPGGAICGCALVMDAKPGWELFAKPGARP